MISWVGQTVSHYRILQKLGEGGMSTVYLAEDIRHRRKVAIKVLLPELSAVLGPERFLKEIELTANLQHPNILPLFDSGVTPATPLVFIFGTSSNARTLNGDLGNNNGATALRSAGSLFHSPFVRALLFVPRIFALADIWDALHAADPAPPDWDSLINLLTTVGQLLRGKSA